MNAEEIAEFLILFRAVNIALNQVVPESDRHKVRSPSEEEVHACRQSLSKFSPRQLNSFFAPSTRSPILQIEKIRRASPMEFGLVGCAFLIVIGVIMSGGRIQITASGVKAVLPPFGRGLKCLREALGLDKQVQAGFGIRETTIQLNKAEFAELMAPTTGSGGFQHFLAGLQYRVNKQTRKLTLSPEDLERIYRYKSDPQKGGWQARFQKIFGRHFP